MKALRLLSALVLVSSLGACGRAPEPDDSDYHSVRTQAGSGAEMAGSAMAGAEMAGAEVAGSAMAGAEMTPSVVGRIAPTTTTTAAAPVEGAGDLLHPTADLRAPDTYAVEMATDAGAIIIDVTRAWSPAGADRFYTLVRLGYFTNVAFFRVIPNFMAQAGIHGDPAVNRVWMDRNIPDDRPGAQSNTRGMVTFAKTGMPNSRSNQFFINFRDNSNLDRMGFTPFGRVRDMAAVDQVYSGYGEGAPRGRGPNQGTIQSRGNAYLSELFPELTYIRSARILD